MNKNCFKITGGKGFQITFPNGVTASVQFGRGNYCENRFKSIPTETDCESSSAEVFAYDKDGNSIGNPQGWQSPAEVLEFLNSCAAMGKDV